VYRQLQRRLEAAVREFVQRQYGHTLTSVVIEQPPRVELGEYALPLAFELAKKLKKAPRKIAEEIVGGMGAIPGFEKLEVAGAGYINARVERAAFAAEMARTEEELPARHDHEKVLVEHTSINPNKAAHIGHLRNAILGDTFVRLLRADGYKVDIQNYIDNTGVQVADVVVGFVNLEKESKADVARLIQEDLRFDYTCWDLYARVSQWYEQSKDNLKARVETLHAIEAGNNELAEIADMIGTDIVRRHLRTMQRLDIVYDFLPRESEILHLHFWDAAFQQLKEKKVLYFVEEGKNKGCWVMDRKPKSEPQRTQRDHEGHEGKALKRGDAEESPENAEKSDAEENQKVIVRSNGTVTYVAKDIAYHLWKFGLLGKDFGYRRFYQYPDQHWCWISTDPQRDEPGHPHFGGVAAIYNVIDSRQADPQNNVVEAIRALGYTDQAEHYTHFAYDMVALTPRCAMELGYDVPLDEQRKAYIEVSGRKGFGVKADDLIDQLIAAAAKEVNTRHAELEAGAQRTIAEQIAIGALRYFMLRFTRNSVIAFDLRDALAFEGETGPYAQYAAVRALNIFRKGDTTPEAALAERVEFGDFLNDDELWSLWLTAGKVSYIIEQCIATAEPAYLAKYAFQLAQQFSNFYHRHHILTESDEARKKFLLATAAVVRRELVRALGLMGVTVPEVM
jgi:arginyl-tRNA synthetase